MRRTVVNELFHISHVGSTLLAKVVQSVPASISYREPTIFKDITNRHYDFTAARMLFWQKKCPAARCDLRIVSARREFEHIFIKQTSGNLILPVKWLLNPGFPCTSGRPFFIPPPRISSSHAVKSQGRSRHLQSVAHCGVGYFNRLCTFRRIELADLKPLEKVALIWVNEMQKLNPRSNLSG